MNFFVSYGDDFSPITKVFRLTGQDYMVTFKNVIDKFAEICNSKDGIQLNTEQLKLYIVDNTYPFRDPIPKEITNLETPVTQLNLSNFDLILSADVPKLKPPMTPTNQADLAKLDQSSLQFEELIQKGQISLATKDYHNAWTTFRHARVLSDQDYRALYYSIKVLIAAHRYPLAIANATTGLQLFPSNREMHLLYAKIHYKMEKFASAIDMYQFSLHNWDVTIQEKQSVYCKIAKCMIALGQLGEALALIENVTDNANCIYTVANIYLIQDRFYEACKKAISSFFITPDYRKMEKFIYNAIINKERAEIFLNELGDSKNDPSTIFFFGHSLYKCGEFQLAIDYFVSALSKSTMVSSISLATLRCLISNCESVDVIKNFARKFLELNITRNFTEAVKPIINNTLQSDVGKSDNETRETKPIKEIAFESEEPSFRTEDIDALSFIITFQLYMFQNGYISLSEQISNALSPLILPFDMTSAIAAQDSITFLYLTAFAPTIPRPINSDLEKIYVIGDRTILTFAYREVVYRGSRHLLTPLIVDYLSLRSLDEKKRTPQHSHLRKYVLGLPKSSTVLLFFGGEDVIVGKVKQSIRMKYDNIESAYQDYINTYTVVASQLVDQIKGTVLVHPVIPTATAVVQQALIFNQMLKEKINGIAEVKKSLHFLDTIQLFMKEDMTSIKPEFNYQDSLITPEYINTLSNYLSENFK
ncbi:hypothetical protein TVAG_211250 [Trichomonas vaginalis G3]|uniref:TPR Domain containing protein n=1 Tax=Trichomonas vaginalis (strain ATCC PRA-98 / G3) TaxID=412133 RepID=A2EKW7_TRIV3|nr:TPR-like family [Trichomonas vaginalis G3]EAY06675.1 hypothetical protein TVAG_211250 [Trichomonas vaginalis G3]KAI5491731.1 TPR-like family [Trichomonas vaginalis G3]|eukprot:XP_001318898.1 hypothetical protein [Trichomonas vaginalis G3]